jgi:predicted  nucleic acid-binding Zn-ribbon protein
VVADAYLLVQGPFTSTLPLFTPTIPIPTSGQILENPVSQPASLDAVVDALLQEVSDLGEEHHRLRLEVQNLQDENSHARDTEARVRGEVEAVKTRVAERSKNITLTQRSNRQPGVRSHRTRLVVTP